MSKDDILKELGVGHMVAHKRFLHGEFIHLNPRKTHYLDEDGNVISINYFWKYRTAESWKKDWKVVD